SYIVEGLGNEESFNTCSHGAGRVMSRNQANQVITREMAEKAMGNIVHKGFKKDLSEAPMAYKDIEEVMENQKDLVKPLVKLTPLGVIKG
ncbi:MAG: RtcB family protein, partial [Tissierellia bacterium]|nr:RtcB family protein [Tissierellia bacterium]